MNWKNWMTDQTFFLLAALAGWFWLLWRFEQLRKQLKAVCESLRAEIAESAGNEERANEIRRDWREDRDEEKKLNRRSLTFWGVIGAGMFAYWWYTQH
jgi:hypothetical protein